MCHHSNHGSQQRKPEQVSLSHKAQITTFCSRQWTSRLALSSLGWTQNALTASVLASVRKTTSSLHESEETHEYAPEDNSGEVNSRHIARRHSETRQQSKPDSSCCDKTSSHLAAVHAVYQLTYYFTWYTHSLPDEHRPNKPLKDSCELYKHWNQKWARHQPSEMQIGNRTHLHRLNPTAPKRRHRGHICQVGTHRPPYIFLHNDFIGLGFSSLGVWFSTSLGNQIFHLPPPACLTGEEQGLEGSLWSSSWKFTVFYAAGSAISSITVLYNTFGL